MCHEVTSNLGMRGLQNVLNSPPQQLQTKRIRSFKLGWFGIYLHMEKNKSHSLYTATPVNGRASWRSLIHRVIIHHKPEAIR